MKLSEYRMQTDWSLMPWSQTEYSSGIITIRSSSFIQQNHLWTNNSIVAFIEIAKSNERFIIRRSFQRITDVLSFVGGLLGPMLLAASILKFYNKFSFQIEFGYRAFKPSNSSSACPQNFNFYAFTKLMIFSILKKIKKNLKWQESNQYLQCRVEVTKPLDTYLLFQKIAFFEHALSTLLEEHHQMGLHMLAKTSFRQARKKRKRYIIQELFNGKLERLSRVVSLSDQQVRKERQMILKDYGEKYQRQKCNKKLSLQQQFSKKYEKLQIQSEKGCIYSRKIISKLNLVGEPQDELISISEDEEHKQKNPQTLQNNLQTNTELIRSNQTL